MNQKKKLLVSQLKKSFVTEALAFKLLASLESLVNHDTYETEYDGQMLTYCHDCGWLEHKTHSATCAYIEAKNLVEESYTTPIAQPVQTTTHNFEITEDHIELLATMLHCVPTGESELFKELNAFCHDARTAFNKEAIAQPVHLGVAPQTAQVSSASAAIETVAQPVQPTTRQGGAA